MRAMQRSWRVRLVLVAVALLAGTGLLFVGTRWEARLAERIAEAHFSVGPLGPGEAVEQRFAVSAAFLSSLQVIVHSRDGDLAATSAPLLFRLYDGGRIVREGMVHVGLWRRELQTVTWEFPPLEDSGNRELVLQLAVGAGSEQPLYVMASLIDYLPGSLVSNGVPSDNLDLTLITGRAIARSQILRAIALGHPMRLGLAAILVVLVAGSAAGQMMRGDRATARRLTDRVLLTITALALLAFSTALVINLSANVPAAETRPQFWLALATAPLVAALILWHQTIFGRILVVANLTRQAPRLLVAVGPRLVVEAEARANQRWL